MTSEDPVARLRPHCSRVGFDLDTAEPLLLERVRSLGTKTFEDAVRMAGLAHRVFDYYASAKPAQAFSPLEKRTVVLGSLFSDIGKTGPVDADASGRQLIVDMFAVENVRDDKQSVAAFLRASFPADAEKRIHTFTTLGLDPTMTLRAFWNLHSSWTLAIAEAAGIPVEAVAAAATHHLMDDVNPQGIVGADTHFTRRFGENTAFDRAEKLVIILDKYDAARRRGSLDHAAAIAWLRDRIAKNPRFKDDAELHELVTDVDAALA